MASSVAEIFPVSSIFFFRFRRTRKVQLSTVGTYGSWETFKPTSQKINKNYIKLRSYTADRDKLILFKRSKSPKNRRVPFSSVKCQNHSRTHNRVRRKHACTLLSRPYGMYCYAKAFDPIIQVYTWNNAIDSLWGNQFESSTTKVRVRVLLGQLNSKHWPNITYTGQVTYYAYYYCYRKKINSIWNHDTTLRSVECLVRFVGFIIELFLRSQNVLYRIVVIVARLRRAVFPQLNVVSQHAKRFGTA